ncbi:M23 family metallopeptidase [Microbacterium sp. ASV49]|uniref:M23 family metallopeptidase n=1 Tax=Microbacterium candidum TaxID=3041922 RepID=A0ABT7N332_9MICO|nr:M23 family metallopeptidase [Microbacterium sp. ASV49]MDL9981114.1 M23 family metallopeptidase [Microbacterium sp. ASV49]
MSTRTAAVTASTRTAPAPRRKRGIRKPLKAVVVLAMVGGLVATVAIPAFASLTPTASAQTLQQASADDAQKIVVASDATAAAIDRDGYSATTPDELAKAKAEAAALARAKAKASTASVKFKMNLGMVAPGSGAVRWPVAHVDHIGDGFMARGGEHHGVDLLDPAGTPIFAAAAGTVRVSTESYYAYGVAIVIDSVINGQRVSTTYAHMTYGSRQVQVGQTVAAGQLIGAVGSTGRSTANHLHFEVTINGTLVDPLAWLEANAGPVP